MNRADNAYLKKVCKSVHLFAIIPEMAVPNGQTGLFKGPGLESRNAGISEVGAPSEKWSGGGEIPLQKSRTVDLITSQRARGPVEPGL